MLLSRVMVFGVVASASSTSPASDAQMKGVSIFLSGQTENAQNLFLKKLVVDGQVASAAGGRGIARTGSSPPESEQPKATSSSLPSTGPNLLFDIEGRSAVQRRLLADNTMRLPVGATVLVVISSSSPVYKAYTNPPPPGASYFERRSEREKLLQFEVTVSSNAGTNILSAVGDTEKKRMLSKVQNPGFAINDGDSWLRQIPFRDVLTSTVEVWDNNPLGEQLPDFFNALSAEKRSFRTCKPLLDQLMGECCGDTSSTALLIAAARQLEVKHKQARLDDANKKISRQTKKDKEVAAAQTPGEVVASFERGVDDEFKKDGSATLLIAELEKDLGNSFDDQLLEYDAAATARVPREPGLALQRGQGRGGHGRAHRGRERLGQNDGGVA